jgi:magnesium-transporting ATPase (P-type)
MFHLTQLQSVVKHFTEQKLRVLVLARKHLLRGKALPAMKQEAFVFATEDLYVFFLFN